MSWSETYYLKMQIDKLQETVESTLQNIEGQIPIVASDEDSDNSPDGVDVNSLTDGNTWFIVEGE